MSGDTDRLAQIEPDLVGATIIRLHVGREINDKERAEFEALVEIAKAARELSDFLENIKETHEPSRDDLDNGYVALESSADYEREEELAEALRAALSALGTESNKE